MATNMIETITCWIHFTTFFPHTISAISHQIHHLALHFRCCFAAGDRFFQWIGWSAWTQVTVAPGSGSGWSCSAFNRQPEAAWKMVNWWAKRRNLLHISWGIHREKNDDANKIHTGVLCVWLKKLCQWGWTWKQIDSSVRWNFGCCPGNVKI